MALNTCLRHKFQRYRAQSEDGKKSNNFEVHFDEGSSEDSEGELWRTRTLTSRQVDQHSGSPYLAPSSLKVPLSPSPLSAAPKIQLQTSSDPVEEFLNSPLIPLSPNSLGTGAHKRGTLQPLYLPSSGSPKNSPLGSPGPGRQFWKGKSSPSGSPHSSSPKLGKNNSFSNLSRLTSMFSHSLNQLENVDSCETAGAISKKNEDLRAVQQAIISLFQRKTLREGSLQVLHEHVQNLLHSGSGPFIYEYYQNQLLKKGAIILREELKQKEDTELLEMLADTWNYFYKVLLSTLQAILYQVQPKQMDIRKTTLVAFRDIVLLKIGFADALDSLEDPTTVSPAIRQMLLVLQSVADSYPPNEHRLQLELLVARVIRPYLGFFGIYNGSPEPVVKSFEPQTARIRKTSVEKKRLMRPLSTQPRGIDKLQDLFVLSARRGRKESERE